MDRSLSPLSRPLVSVFTRVAEKRPAAAVVRRRRRRKRNPRRTCVLCGQFTKKPLTVDEGVCTSPVSSVDEDFLLKRRLAESFEDGSVTPAKIVLSPSLSSVPQGDVPDVIEDSSPSFWNADAQAWQNRDGTPYVVSPIHPSRLKYCPVGSDYAKWCKENISSSDESSDSD